jgi:molybdate transport system substrate-binding protein
MEVVMRFMFGVRGVSRLALVGALLTFAVSTQAPVRANDVPVIAAAADLNFALTEVSQQFHERTGKAVKLTFGSSGNFFTQIKHGAPFQLYLSADEAYVERLAQGGLTKDEGTLYAVGRIVVFAPKGSPLKVDGSLTGLAAALRDGQISRFAIANPEHAPYGRAARQALEAAGLWPNIQPFLIFGENASQAMHFASSGSAQGGIVPLSLALAPQMKGTGTWTVLPETFHVPLRQRMALLKNAGEAATAFYNFMQTAPAREIMQRYGFVLPVSN